MSTKATTDIYFAAVLLASGAKLEKTDRTDPRHMVFHFSSPMRVLPPALAGAVDTGFVSVVQATLKQEPLIDLEKLEVEWVNQSLSINAYQLCEAVKRMKSIVHTHA